MIKENFKNAWLEMCRDRQRATARNSRTRSFVSWCGQDEVQSGADHSARARIRWEDISRTSLSHSQLQSLACEAPQEWLEEEWPE